MADAFAQLLIGDKAALGAFGEAALKNQTNIQNCEADVARMDGLLRRQNKALRMKGLANQQLKRESSKKDCLLKREKRDNEEIRRRHASEMRTMRAEFFVEHNDKIALKKELDQVRQKYDADMKVKDAALMESRKSQQSLETKFLEEKNELIATHDLEEAALKKNFECNCAALEKGFTIRIDRLYASFKSELLERDLRQDRTSALLTDSKAAHDLTSHELSLQKNLNCSKDVSVFSFMEDNEEFESDQKKQLQSQKALVDKEMAISQSVDAANQKRLDKEKAASMLQDARTQKRLSKQSAGLSTMLKNVENSACSRLNTDYISYVNVDQSQCTISSEIGDPIKLKSLLIVADREVTNLRDESKSKSAKKNHKRRQSEIRAKKRARAAMELGALATSEDGTFNDPELDFSAAEVLKVEPDLADLFHLPADVMG